MMNRTETIKENDLNRYDLHQKVISSLSMELGILDIRAGNVTIRDERNWRVNEKEIAYCWLVNISRSFVGWYWLFSIKFKESHFRDRRNPKELIQGIFSINKDGAIEEFYKENQLHNFKDPIKDLSSYDMFDANLGTTLDGVSYEYLIFAPNTEIKISLNNPNSKNWKTWEDEVLTLCNNLGQKSGITEFEELFK